jgi:Domain of unknown function (DUF5916)
VKHTLLILTLAISIFAQQTPASADLSQKLKPVVVPKFSTEPVIDGKLDDEIWKSAAVFKDFIQIRPGDNIAASKETIAYLGYDEKNLYFSAMCFDEPDKIRATLAKRDDVGGDDNVRITLDTFNDQRRAYTLFFNPLGIQADGITTEGGGGGGQGGPDLSVDIVMESKGVILENGWSIEAKIPFKSLRYISGKGKFWGINISRSIQRLNGELDSWSRIERGISPLQQLGKITGLNDIKTERNLEIVPSITLSESGQRIESTVPPNLSRILNKPVKQDIGVSIKYQITPNVTLDAAINPDFAEVESDSPVVLANTRFPTFFPEKRPFFLEGNDFFRTPLQVVNTRNIADPDIALKLTGKTGLNTFGILTAVDRFPNTKTKAYIGVLRLKRDIGTQSNIGLLATTYHFGSRRHNTLLGFDGKFQTSKQANFNFQVVGTKSNRNFRNRDTDAFEYRSGNGIAYQVNYDYTGRNRGVFFGVNGRSKDFIADVGFRRRTDTHGATFGFRLGTQPKPNNTLIGIVTRHFSSYVIDEQGRLQETNYNLNGELTFQKQLQVRFGVGLGVEKIYEDEFGARRNANQSGGFFGDDSRGAFQKSFRVDVDKNINKRISVDAGVKFARNDLDLDFGANERFNRVSPWFLSPLRPALNEQLDPGKGNSFGYDVGVDLTPTDPLTISLSYEREKLTRNDTKLTAFDSNIFSLRSTYQFTRFIFARTRIDYDTLDATLNSQLLFGWSPNPGTAFYVGYNDNSSYKGYNDFREEFDNGFRRDGRRFFIRMSYLFRRSF